MLLFKKLGRACARKKRKEWWLITQIAREKLRKCLISSMPLCPFCTPNTIQRQVIFETPLEWVLYNIRQANPGRCLVVPKRHVTHLRALDAQEAASLFVTVQRVSGILQSYLQPDGINYGFNEGRVAGQMVEHFHFHILPRFADDSHPKHHLFHAPPDAKKDLNNDELEKRVAEFRDVFEQQG